MFYSSTQSSAADLTAHIGSLNRPGVSGAPSLEEDGVVGRASQYPPELRERAVRMVVEVTADYPSQ